MDTALHTAGQLAAGWPVWPIWPIWPIWQLGLALVATACLFGGMLLYAGGFAAVLFTSLPVAMARGVIRRAFPPFYLWVIATAGVAAALLWTLDPFGAWVMAAVALTTIPARQVLMPAINAASDSGNRRSFNWLHSLSVLITLLHIAATGLVLLRFVM